MSGETNLETILKTLQPKLNPGIFVFCSWNSQEPLPMNIISFFKEEEGLTIILSKENADQLNLSYSYEAAWITLQIHSSLNAVGLTAAFSTALAKENVSANVMAANFHDHIFVDIADAEKAIYVLQQLSQIHN